MTIKKGYCKIAVIILACSGLLMLISPVHAYSVGQGDTVYLNDTCDLSLVVSWPDYQLAWCSSGQPDCSSPYIIDLGYENQHRVLITPDRFKIGSYYRWDGAWHRGENMYAMEVSSIRPVPKIIVENNTIVAIEQNVTEAARMNNTHILLARGDAINYTYTPENSVDTGAYIWMFRSNADSTGYGILGERMIYSYATKSYTWEIPYTKSETIPEGEYSGYIQLVGLNKHQDVFFSEHHETAKYVYEDVLDTLYDDNLVPDVPITGLTQPVVKARFDTLISSGYIDDIFIPITMTVASPALFFVDYYENDNGNLTITGTTTTSENTIISFALDPDQHPVKRDAVEHTWITGASGDVNEMRTFTITLPIKWDELGIGVHTIIASIDKYNFNIKTNKDFRVSDIYVFPTPTPDHKKILVEEYGWHRIDMESSNQSAIGTGQTVSGMSVTQTTPATMTATPSISLTPALAPAPTPTRDPNIHLPVPIWIPVAAMLTKLIMIKRKR